MASSDMLRRVVLVRTDVSEDLSASIRVTVIGELGTTLAVTSIRRMLLRLLVTANVPRSPILVTLMMEALSSSETSVLTRATRRNIPEDTILQSEIQFQNKNKIQSRHICTSTYSFTLLYILVTILKLSKLKHNTRQMKCAPPPVFLVYVTRQCQYIYSTLQ
jgi:hypothetical protein